MSLLNSRGCIWKCSAPPPHTFVLPMDLEIKLHLCCFLVCAPTLSAVLRVASEDTMSAPHPQPGSDSAGGFLGIRYWPDSGTPDAADRGEMRSQSAFLLIGARNKCVPPIYLSLSVPFFARAAINTWLLVRNNSYGTFTEKCLSILVVFSLCVVKGI